MLSGVVVFSREPILASLNFIRVDRVHTNFNDTQRYVSERDGFIRPIVGEICNISAAQIHGRVARWFSSERERERTEKKLCARPVHKIIRLCSFVR